MSALLKFAARYRNENAALGLKGWDDFMAQNSSAPDSLLALQKRCAEKINERGLPTQKLERFKYINIPSFLKKNELKNAPANFTFDGAVDFAAPLEEKLSHDWVQELMEAEPASEDQYGDMMLWDLNTVFTQNGLVIDVPKNTTADKPINIRHKGEGGNAYSPRQIIRAAENAEITIIELYTGEGTYAHNGVTQIHVGKNARVKHYRLNEASDESLHIQNTHIVIEEGANFECFTYTTGAKMSRHQVHVDMLGVHAEVHVNGLNLLEDKQLGDTTITVDHRAPHCQSNQNYRNVLTDSATGIFQGKVHVHQIAQKTDGYQFAKSLLLSPLATMNTKPELEIYADDVKCSHGTTSGEIDEQAMFYMRSRGIPESQARALLIEAFIAEVIEDISSEDMKEHITHRMGEWLSRQVTKGRA